ncbi:MAG: ATP-binding domain-containing protein, partial [Actinobacteria bacterium]|nr:ATP-binding domain-containing protein [Actinomycetota bacterium]
FGAPALIALASRGALSAGEQAALERPRSPSLEAIPWTPADLPLLDEARVLLGSRRPKAEELRTYGHIVVDEAQDLTPMQLRMLTRRSLSGSMTVVGDIAQATGHHAPSGWDDVTKHLPHKKPAHVVELSVNYRTPAEIMEVAGRVLAAVSPDLRPPQSVRSTGRAPVFVAAHAAGELVGAVGAAVRAQREDVGGGTVAVISPPSLVEVLADGLPAAGLDVGSAETDGLDTPVTLISVTVVKGLEFDGVVVVEPAAIVRESPQGLHALYVALTRATKTLTVVHAEPLPPSLPST